MSKSAGAGGSEQIRSSLVLKLNLHLTGRLISGLISLNLCLLLLSLFVILGRAELRAQDLIAAVESTPENLELLNRADRNYRLSAAARPPEGFSLPAPLQKHLGLAEGVKRSLVIPPERKGLRFRDKIWLTTYNFSFPATGGSYRLVYSLGADLKLLFRLALVLLGIEFLLLIRHFRKGSRAIKRTLKPLSEMARKARQLNDALRDRGAGDETQLRDLAGAIGDIDASRLDRRLPVDESQTELRELAAAINGMLNRIGAAYQSQLRFVSDASHELRTPIAVIQGYTNLLDRWGKKDEKTLQESIDAIKSETEGMKALVEQLLFLARGDNDTLQLHREDFDASDLVEEAVAEAKMINPLQNFELGLARPALIGADKQLFKQVVRILIDNSIKYSPAGEIIVIRVQPAEGAVRISVQDQGIGIAAPELPNIFERFYRSDESRARKTGGAGLGLSIARWIVERHGGHVEVLSRPGIGTRLTVVFPSLPPLRGRVREGGSPP